MDRAGRKIIILQNRQRNIVGKLEIEATKDVAQTHCSSKPNAGCCRSNDLLLAFSLHHIGVDDLNVLESPSILLDGVFNVSEVVIQTNLKRYQSVTRTVSIHPLPSFSQRSRGSR
jgi:hypothetical protein